MLLVIDMHMYSFLINWETRKNTTTMIYRWKEDCPQQ